LNTKGNTDARYVSFGISQSKERSWVSLMPPLSTLISCVQKETDYRIKRYPKWVEAGNMDANIAAQEINSMKWVLFVLQLLNQLMEKLR
jgi:hypothetical protein